eukprot:1006407-Prymnesium_polylepis.1
MVRGRPVQDRNQRGGIDIAKVLGEAVAPRGDDHVCRLPGSIAHPPGFAPYRQLHLLVDEHSLRWCWPCVKLLPLDRIGERPHLDLVDHVGEARLLYVGGRPVAKACPCRFARVLVEVSVAGTRWAGDQNVARCLCFEHPAQEVRVQLLERRLERPGDGDLPAILAAPPVIGGRGEIPEIP